MKAIKVLEIKKLYSIMFSKKDGINESLSVVEIHDNNTNKTHFSKWHGVTDSIDLLPNGPLYLSDNFEDVIRKLERN